MGWLPFILHMAVAEGHNDIVMVMFLVCWLWLVAEQRHLLSPVALAAATLIKYITAPLALLEVLRGWTRDEGAQRPICACASGSVAGQRRTAAAFRA